MQFKLVNQALVLALALPVLASAQVTQPSASAPSIAGLPQHPVSPAARTRAETAARDGVPVAELAPDAPPRYTVKRGDTLWRISGMYLRNPWRWPDLWGMNMGRIRNPHWIFPGQVLVLTIVNGVAHLSVVGDASGDATEKLEPSARAEDYVDNGIPAVDPALLAPFLTRPLIVEPEEEAVSPRIVAVAPGHVMLSPGERAFVRGPVGGATRYDVYRPSKALTDPRTHAVVGYASDYLGTVDLAEPPSGPDAVASVDVRSVEREMGIGDRLIAEPPRESLDFAPHAPAVAVDGDVVSIADDREMVGRDGVVAIDRGSADGLQPGDVLAVLDAPRTVVDRTDPDHPTVELPAQRDGLAMVFRSFRHVAFAIVLQAKEPIAVGARVTQP